MIHFELSMWPRLLRNPVVATGLIVDLLPIFAVVSFGWGAFELVLLYWLENLIIGFITLCRILLAGFAKGKISELMGAIFLSCFFAFHYGMFCLVHGMFLFNFLGGKHSFPFSGQLNLFNLGQADAIPGLVPILGVIIAWQFFYYVFEFVRSGEHFDAEPNKEMFAPYGRIVVLHLGIFAGAFALGFMGDPMVGVLALILFRAAIGIVINLFLISRRKLD